MKMLKWCAELFTYLGELFGAVGLGGGVGGALVLGVGKGLGIVAGLSIAAVASFFSFLVLGICVLTYWHFSSVMKVKEDYQNAKRNFLQTYRLYEISLHPACQPAINIQQKTELTFFQKMTSLVKNNKYPIRPTNPEKNLNTLNLTREVIKKNIPVQPPSVSAKVHFVVKGLFVFGVCTGSIAGASGLLSGSLLPGLGIMMGSALAVPIGGWIAIGIVAVAISSIILASVIYTEYKKHQNQEKAQYLKENTVKMRQEIMKKECQNSLKGKEKTSQKNLTDVVKSKPITSFAQQNNSMWKRKPKETAVDDSNVSYGRRINN